MTKVTVVTTTYRPWDRLLDQLKDLEAQTLKDIQWVVVDDHLKSRNFKLAASFPIVHVEPLHGVVDYFAPAHADNTALIYAEGELVFFMNDYVRLLPTALERHWEIYQRYGPKVIIAGQLMPMDGQLTFPKREWEVRLGLHEGEVFNEMHPAVWLYSAGRNDSAPLKDLLELNGLDETMDGGRGGSDVDIAIRLMRHGCRYIVFDDVPAFDYAHHAETNPSYTWGKALPGHKGGKHWQEWIGKHQVADRNNWSIEVERRVRQASTAGVTA